MVKLFLLHDSSHADGHNGDGGGDDDDDDDDNWNRWLSAYKRPNRPRVI